MGRGFQVTIATVNAPQRRARDRADRERCQSGWLALFIAWCLARPDGAGAQPAAFCCAWLWPQWWGTDRETAL